MASVINTNNASLVAQRNLATSQTDLTTSVQRLSSGLRINSAKDDAAGLGISQKLQAQITGANVAARNANDAISMLQTAEGGMQEVSTMLQRMRELATQGNNDSLDNTQRVYIANEIDALRDEIAKVATRTTFNGDGLLDGSLATGGSAAGLSDFQVGTAATDSVDISELFKDVALDTTAAFGTLDADITTLQTASTSLSASFGTLTTTIDTAIATVAGYRGAIGAMNNRLDYNIANLQNQAENLTASMSRIMDTDYAAETAQLSKNQVMQQAATAMLAQANQMPNAVLSLLK